MQSISVSPCNLCHCPLPQQPFQRLVFSNTRTITACLSNTSLFTSSHFFTLTATNSFSCEPRKKKRKITPYPYQQRALLQELCSFSDDRSEINRTQKRRREETGGEIEESANISTNMWWVNIKAAMGQRISLEGIVSTVAVVAKDQHLALPHISVKDVRYIDWAYLKSNGFQGVVFDKDNTLTVPYSLTLWQRLGSSVERCKYVFGNDIAVFSNSAGLNEFDPDGRKAKALEGSIGIKVIRHTVKKPAGTAEEIERHFGCESSRLIMVGDRPFTDIVYGNRNGFLTILTEPLSLAEEPFIVKQVRKLEIALVNRWFRKGLKPLSNRLLPDAQQCVKDPPPL